METWYRYKLFYVYFEENCHPSREIHFWGLHTSSVYSKSRTFVFKANLENSSNLSENLLIVNLIFDWLWLLDQHAELINNIKKRVFLSLYKVWDFENGTRQSQEHMVMPETSSTHKRGPLMQFCLLLDKRTMQVVFRD